MCRIEFSNRLVVIAFSAIISILFFIPQLYGFVGTDIGDYFEIGRRLWSDGYLELWGNYWDHKTPYIYIFFSLFAPLDSLAPGTGVKVGSLLLYLTCNVMFSWAITTNTDFKRQGHGHLLQHLTFILIFNLLVLGWLDLVSNGVLLVIITSISFFGLKVITSRSSRTFLILSGVLLGTTPYWRQSGISIVIPLFLSFYFDLKDNFDLRKVTFYTLPFFLSLALGLLITTSLGADTFRSLIEFNIHYGRYFRGTTSPLDFFTQDYLALIVILSLLAILVTTLALSRSRLNRQQQIILLWCLVEILAMTYQRKIQSFYLLGVILPLLSTTVTMTDSLRGVHRSICNVILLLVSAMIGYKSYTGIDPAIFRNSFISQSNHETGQIIKTLNEYSCEGLGSNLLVYGNRAQIYSIGALHGIEPYCWDLLTNPLVDGGLFPDKQEILLQKMHESLPRYIVYVGGYESWSPNIGGRFRRLEELIESNYQEIGRPKSIDTQAPYNFNYRLFINKSCKFVKQS